MARPYTEEMMKLSETFAWAAAADVEPLRQAVRTAGLSPLCAVGSGGSLTGAHALAGLHQRYTGCLATVATPLQAVEEPLNTEAATWLLSARGSNVDVVAAAKTLILREPRQLGVLCGGEASPLAELCRQHPFVDLLLYPPPTGKDGFLATNSLLGFTGLLMRSYAAEFGSDTDWKDVVDCLKPLLSGSPEAWLEWQTATAPLWTRNTTLVLYGPATRIGAVDLESKFTEAAIGHVQLADYRNFAHGRHHWLAKRSDTSGVLAFITSADRELAERTLSLIPTAVPQARIEFDGGPNATAMASLVSALRITGWAGFARGIDPGRPGVPGFGRKLYRLSLRRRRRIRVLPNLTRRDAVAITRKAGADPERLAMSGELEHWRHALVEFRSRLCDAHYAGIVLDYDGTIVDTRYRYMPANPQIAAELIRLAEAGGFVAIATGRGASVRRDLRCRLPRALWPHILVGYYNGAEVASLDDDATPDGTHNTCAFLQPLAAALRHQPELAEYARQEERCSQITLEAKRFMPNGRLWDLARHVILLTGIEGINVTSSGHTIDIIAPGVSKINTVQRLRQEVCDAPILVIGDRGRWPGNDYELLREPYALGVDEISVDPATCWNLGEPGQRGPTVTLDYLSALETNDGRLRFPTGALR